MKNNYIVSLAAFFLIFGSQPAKTQDGSQSSNPEIYVAVEDSSFTDGVRISPDGKLIATNGARIKLWDGKTGKELKTIPKPANRVIFSEDSKFLIIGHDGLGIIFWDLEKDREIVSQNFKNDEFLNTLISLQQSGGLCASPYYYFSSLAINFDTQLLAIGLSCGKIILWDLKSNQIGKIIQSPEVWEVDSLEFDVTGKKLAFTYSDGKILKATKTNTVYLLKDIQEGLKNNSTSNEIAVSHEQLEKSSNFVKFLITDFKVNVTSFGQDNFLLASGENERGEFTIKNLEKQEIVKKFASKLGYGWDLQNNLLLTSFYDNKTGESKYILTDVKNNLTVTQLKTVKNDGRQFHAFQSIKFQKTDGNNDGLAITTVSGDTITIGLTDGKFIYYENLNSNVPEDSMVSVETSSLRTENTDFIAEVSDRQVVTLKDKKTKKTLINIYWLSRENWLVYTPEGRFDMNFSIDEAENIHWILSNDWRNPLSFEIFMREYYEPKLLERILNGEKLKPIPSIVEINKVQPIVKIKSVTPVPNSVNLVNVTVEVNDIMKESSTTNGVNKMSSGVYDVKLFRNGQMVKTSTTDKNLRNYLEKTKEPGFSDENDKTLGETEKSLWRTATDFKNNFSNKFDQNGKAILTFENIKISKTADEKIIFSAYAFNSDRVKSLTDNFEFKVNLDDFKNEEIARNENKKNSTNQLPEIFAPSATYEVITENTPPVGKVYLISIGVNFNDNPKLNLTYAANDAEKIQQVLTPLLKNNDNFTEVISIPLISDKKAGKLVNNATKPIIRGVFSLLAGKPEEVSSKEFSQIPNAPSIKPVNPDDTIIISFSGHGYADKNGIFYLIPSDTGKNTNSIDEVLNNSISSDELSYWFQDITAQEMLFVIDACHSATAIEGKEFKPGPMGSRGLGQLAFDKGMRILTATQADNVALESDRLEQGLLTYALIQEAVLEGRADTELPGLKLSINEWWSFAVGRVPQLYNEIKSGKRNVKVDGKISNAQTNSKLLTMNSETKSAVNIQQPSVFNFNKNKSKYTLFNVPIKIQNTVARKKELEEEKQREIESKIPPTPVKILFAPKASYTDEARRNDISGDVILRIEFLSSGRIGNIVVVKGLDYGLTENAIYAAKQIRFQPATKFGRPVTQRQTVKFNFSVY